MGVTNKKKRSDLIKSEQANELIDWFEQKYSPGSGRAAEIIVKGIKGNIVIHISYYDDLYKK